MVKTSDGDVLLETTDRIGGFIDDEKRISKVIADYRKNFSLFVTVDVDQLPGLLYFNQAVKAFNAAKWDECSEKLSAAATKTNSPQVAALAECFTGNLISQGDNRIARTSRAMTASIS